MELLIWILVAIGLYILIAAGYRALTSVKALKNHLGQVQAKLETFGVADVQFEAAEATKPEDLPKLLRVRRSRARAKEQALQERRRRLIQRISSINIDKRSA